MNRGNMHAAHDATDAALADYARVVELGPPQYTQAARIQAAAIHAAAGHPEEAVRLLTEASRGPGRREAATAQFNLGNLLADLYRFRTRCRASELRFCAVGGIGA